MRVVASPTTNTCFVDGGTPEKSLLVPGVGAPAPYDIANRAALYDAIVMSVATDKLSEKSRHSKRVSQVFDAARGASPVAARGTSAALRGGMTKRLALLACLGASGVAAADPAPPPPDVTDDTPVDAGDEVIEMHAQAPRTATDSSYSLSRDEIAHLPGAGTDALAAVRSLPGVASSPASAAGRLTIRGGAPQDGLLEIDGVPVPFVYHSFDNSTILPVEMIGAIAYSPGGFGVEGGRATSGLVGITTSDPSPRARPHRARCRCSMRRRPRRCRYRRRTGCISRAGCGARRSNS